MRIAPTSFVPIAGQAAALAAAAGVDVFVGGVGSGKSLPAAFRLLAWAVGRPRRSDGLPSAWYCLGATLRNVVEQQFAKLREAETYFRRPVIDRVMPGLYNPRVFLRNGATIYGRSGTNPRDYKGDEIEGVWMDEASEQPLLAFALALSRQRAADQVRAVLSTNPRDGWVWDLVRGDPASVRAGADPDAELDPVLAAYEKLRAKLRVTVHRWDVAENVALRPEVLDGIGAVLDVARPELSRQEVGGLFLGGEVRSAACFAGLERAFVAEAPRLTAAESRAHVVGVDLGKQQDWTWFVALSRGGIVLAQDRFNASTADCRRDEFYAHAMERLIDFCGALGARLVRLDLAMQGAAFADQLRAHPRARGRLVIEGYHTDSATRKAEAIHGLDVAFQRGAIQVPRAWVGADGRRREVAHVDALVRELRELVAAPTPTGKLHYDHPQGGHDDGVVALALAFQAVARQTPSGIPSRLDRWLDQPVRPR